MPELTSAGHAGDRGDVVPVDFFSLRTPNVYSEVNARRELIKREARSAIDSFKQYQKRIEFLIEEAAIKELSINRDSLRDVMKFIDRHASIRHGGLTMADDGIFSLIWQNRIGGSRFSMRFTGNGSVRYVITIRLANEESCLQTRGYESIDCVMQKVTKFNTANLLYD